MARLARWAIPGLPYRIAEWEFVDGQAAFNDKEYSVHPVISRRNVAKMRTTGESLSVAEK